MYVEVGNSILDSRLESFYEVCMEVCAVENCSRSFVWIGIGIAMHQVIGKVDWKCKLSLIIYMVLLSGLCLVFIGEREREVE
jgi:hypothetical protein